jgi:hypothetical protein
MPGFANPFSGNVPRPMTHEGLVRAIRLASAAGQDAVHMDTAQARAVCQKAVCQGVSRADRDHKETGRLDEQQRKR